MPSIEDRLLEAELMNSAPEYVYAWLKTRAEAPSSSAPGGDGLEQSLLTRGSNLIDLGLACYGVSIDVVRKLFDREPRDEAEQLLRLAVLSNRALVKRTLLRPIPTLLVSKTWPNEEAVKELVTSASAEEIVALFQNPTIDDSLLREAFARDGACASVTDERWLWLVAASVGNPRLQAEYSGSMDGYAEYSYGRVFADAWRLAETAPVTVQWAHVLEGLFRKLVPKASIGDKMAAIDRWRVPESGADESYAQGGFLNQFETVRFLLTRLISQSELKALLSHEDIAIRCGCYSRCELIPDEMREAFKRETKYFLEHALGNDGIWRDPLTREVLRTLCWADKSDADMIFPNQFKSRSERLKKEHADWFAENEPASTEKPLSLSEVGGVVKAIQANQVEIRRYLIWGLYVLCALLLIALGSLRRC